MNGLAKVCIVVFQKKGLDRFFEAHAGTSGCSIRPACRSPWIAVSAYSRLEECSTEPCVAIALPRAAQGFRKRRCYKGGMKNEIMRHAALSDPDLLVEVRQLVSTERHATARLIAALGELDARRLYLGEGCSSLFTFCTRVLHLSEHAAYGRIEAARAARQWPIVLELVADGSLHLTAVSLLRPHLTDENHRELLAAARHKTKRQVEEIVATVRPQPAVPSTVRKLAERTPPAAKPSSSETARPLTAVLTAPEPEAESARLCPVPSKRIEIKPLAPEQYKVQFTASRETCEKLREAQDLLRHRIPNGDVATIFDRALTLLLSELHKTKHAAVDRPREGRSRATHNRYIPAAVKRAV